jgi:hypothetical protein
MPPTNLRQEHADAINTIASFLAHGEIKSLLQADSVDAIVLCGNSVLPIAEHVFSALEANPDLAKYLVICGGIGHSTQYLYQAVSSHPLYRSISNMVDGLPEAKVLELILEKYYASASMTQTGLKILVEDKSTNCGANAIEAKKVLDKAGLTAPESLIVVQDPTMSLRTLAAFQKEYDGIDVSLKACPTFTPKVTVANGELIWDTPGLQPRQLWDMDRFLELVMGEIPRLRDNESGYGPKGKGFIGHVDIPEEVERAHEGLRDVLSTSR